MDYGRNTETCLIDYLIINMDFRSLNKTVFDLAIFVHSVQMLKWQPLCETPKQYIVERYRNCNQMAVSEFKFLLNTINFKFYKHQFGGWAVWAILVGFYARV